MYIPWAGVGGLVDPCSEIPFDSIDDGPEVYLVATGESPSRLFDLLSSVRISLRVFCIVVWLFFTAAISPSTSVRRLVETC